jgi:hypothetical protein
MCSLIVIVLYQSGINTLHRIFPDNQPLNSMEKGSSGIAFNHTARNLTKVIQGIAGVPGGIERKFKNYLYDLYS